MQFTPLQAPYNHAAAVVTHDSTPLTNEAKALYIGGAGNVKVTTSGGDTVTFTAVPVGTTLNVRVKLVFATLTTATNIIALY